jgi:hypothetical protein
MPVEGSDPVEQRHDHRDVEVDEIVRVLRGYGVLTGERLADLVHAGAWPEHTFKTALRAGIDSGRVKALAGDLYELGERELEAG